MDSNISLSDLNDLGDDEEPYHEKEEPASPDNDQNGPRSSESDSDKAEDKGEEEAAAAHACNDQNCEPEVPLRPTYEVLENFATVLHNNHQFRRDLFEVKIDDLPFKVWSALLVKEANRLLQEQNKKTDMVCAEKIKRSASSEDSEKFPKKPCLDETCFFNEESATQPEAPGSLVDSDGLPVRDSIHDLEEEQSQSPSDQEEDKEAPVKDAQVSKMSES